MVPVPWRHGLRFWRSADHGSGPRALILVAPLDGKYPDMTVRTSITRRERTRVLTMVGQGWHPFAVITLSDT